MRFVFCLVLNVVLSTAAEFEPTAQDSIVPKGSKPELVWAEGKFTEGPTLGPNGIIYFSDIGQRTMRFDPATGKTTVFREPSGKANGLMMNRKGNLIACEGANGGSRRVSLTTLKSKTTTLVDRRNGKRFNSHNDLAIDAKGRIYFTDRPEPNSRPDQTGVHGVYRVDPDGSVTRILTEPEVIRPNGIVISPDDTTLYLLETEQSAAGPRLIRAYDLSEDGTVSNMRVFHDFHPGRSGDGMTIDSAGNLYVAAGLNRLRGTSETLDTVAGVHVFSPGGELLEHIPIPEDTITNAAFGGPDLRTLYVTAGKTLFSFRTDVAGTRR